MDTPDIELSHLRYFIALAEELHFGRAALRLHMAQPPLTRQIQLLESRLQCSLFERNSRSTRLTPAGELLLRRARGLVAEADHTFETLQSVGRGEEGNLTVATAPSLMLSELPRAIRAFRAKYPRVAFRLTEMASSAILQAVRAGAADLGFVRGMDEDPDIQTHLQWGEPMVAMAPHDHALGAKSAVTIAQMRREPFVFFPRDLGPSFYDEVMGFCGRAGFVPSVVQEARQWSSIVSLVSAGMGVSIGPESVASLLPKAVRFLPLKGVRTTVRIVGGRGGSVNAAQENFLGVARRAYAAQISILEKK
jgi:DNA-binding transcriptional LysR family regulator